MTWKEALLTALNARRPRDVVRSAIIGAPAAILGSLGRGPVIGMLLGVWVGVGVFVIDVVDAARQARKRARKEATRVSD